MKDTEYMKREEELKIQLMDNQDEFDEAAFCYENATDYEFDPEACSAYAVACDDAKAKAKAKD